MLILSHFYKNIKKLEAKSSSKFSEIPFEFKYSKVH